MGKTNNKIVATLMILPLHKTTPHLIYHLFLCVYMGMIQQTKIILIFHHSMNLPNVTFNMLILLLLHEYVLLWHYEIQ
jgi:hypothetical protein